MFLYGKELTKREFYQRFGDVSQVGGVKSLTLGGGKAKGIDAYEINTGAGLRFMVLADRCMDIAWTDYQSVPIGFISKAGISSSLYFEHRGDELHRVFGPGLLTTCGLRNVGSPCVVDGEEFAQHGRIHNAPAENVSIDAEWDGDEYRISLKGSMREAVLYKENLHFTRKIETSLGSNTFKITDSIVNLALRDEYVCILYHFNYGYPVIDEGAKLILPPADIVNELHDGRPGRWDESLSLLDGPQQKAKSTLFMRFDEEDIKVVIRNEKLEGFKGIYMKYKRSQLPCFTAWRNFLQGDYVLGLEPANCHVEGRATERATGTLQVLQPGEQRDYHVEIGVLDGVEQIDEFARAIEFTT
jgi:hypothetical protein